MEIPEDVLRRIANNTRHADPKLRILVGPKASPYEQEIRVYNRRSWLCKKKNKMILRVAPGEVLDGRQVVGALRPESSLARESKPPPHYASSGILALKWILVVDNGEGPTGGFGNHGPLGNIYASAFAFTAERLSKGVLIGPNHREFDDGDFIEYDPPHPLCYWRNLFDEQILVLYESDGCWDFPDWSCGRDHDRLGEFRLKRRALGFSQEVRTFWDSSKKAVPDAIKRVRERIARNDVADFVSEIWGPDWTDIPKVILGVQSLGIQKYEELIRMEGPSGGPGGNIDFSSKPLTPDQKITGINVRVVKPPVLLPPGAGRVTGITVDVDGVDWEQFCGNWGSNDNGHVLKPGYFLKRIEGYCGRLVDQLGWTMSDGTLEESVGPFPDGDPIKDNELFTYEAPPGWEICGFHGRHGGALDAIGVYLRPRKLTPGS